MKRKLLVPVSLVLVLALVVLVKPVQTLAFDFLSIFRINDVQTIKITMADLEEGRQTISQLKEELKEKEWEHTSLINVVSQPAHEVKKLADAEDFTAFKLRLPRALASQKPEISAIDSSKMTFTLNVDACNQLLAALHSPKQLSGNLNQVELTMISPASAYVKYDDLLFSATQKSYLDAPEAIKNELREVILDLPMIPQNIRQQLAEIETDSSDIYLPVLVGFGREVDLGGKTGYIYTGADLKAFMQTLPQNTAESGTSHAAAGDEMRAKFVDKHGQESWAAFEEAHQAMVDRIDGENASVLIWVKNGVLYSLIGEKTDAELAKIARSVR